MPDPTMRHSLNPNIISSPVALACGLGLLLGVVSLLFSPLLVFVILVAGAVAMAVLRRPEVALLGILIATSTIIFESNLPIVPIGLGSLHIPDIVLLALFGLIGLRWLVEPDFKIVRTPLDVPLLAFYSVAILSTLIAVLRLSVEVEEARRAIRDVTYYLTFFIVTNLVREDRQLRFLLNGFFLLASIVAVAMIGQFLLGESFSLLPGRVETLYTQGTTYRGIARILPPGQSLILVTFVTITVTLILEKFRLSSMLRFFQWSLSGLAVLLTFTRAFWVQATLALLILGYFVSGLQRRKLVGLGLVSLFLAVIVLLPAIGRPESEVTRLMGASFARLATLGRSDTLREDSLQWRYVENEYVLPQIESHPLLGLGLGAKYRPFDPRIDYVGMDWDATGYIHNGHFWILMKTGLLGYLCLVWLSVAFLIRGFRYWRLVPDRQMKAYVLGFTLAYLGVPIGAIVSPVFMQWYWIPVIGIMMGANEVILRKIFCERPDAGQRLNQVAILSSART